MKKNKGFTLIELLAVIVILAVIALIAVPQVLNILAKSRLGAAEDSANGIINAAETYVTSFMLQNNGIVPNEQLVFNCNKDLGCQLQNTLDEYNLENLNVLDFKGTKPTSGIIVIKHNGQNIIASDLKINEFNCNYINQEIVCDTLNRYKEEILNGADPVLSGNLIGVTIDSDGTVKKADLEKEWYNYENKNWANAVVTKSNKTYKNEEVIPEEDIKQYYVWIPRYRYKLWNVNSESLYPNGTTEPSAINIEFESVVTNVSNGTANGEWLTHPAFTSFETNGIWVGKFETSYDEATYTDNTKFLTTNPNYSAATNGENIIIKPNVRSLTQKTVSQFYTLSRNVNNNLNSHMMKNSEWGAVSYLTYSQYGKCTNTSCEEVYMNNVNTGYLKSASVFTGQLQYSGTITGCSGDSVSVNSNKNTCETGNSYIEAKASTTGNISGIYDMSGGTWEYVMGVLSDINGNPMSGRSNTSNSGFNGTYGCPTCEENTITELTTGIEYPNDTRYYDLYKTNYGLGSNITYDYETGKLGDATKEIAVTGNTSTDRGLWFSDQAKFVPPVFPWFTRGGSFSDGSGAGVLYFSRNGGSPGLGGSSRVVLAY